MSDLRLCEIPTSDRAMLEKIGRLRVRAWETEVGTVEGLTCWLDPIDAVARHWAFLADGEPVASARLSVHETILDVPDPENYASVFKESPPGPIASFNRLVVERAYRRLGLSNRLDAARLEAAELMGCRCAVGATSGERRVRQLIEAGFDVLGQGNRASHPIFARVPPPVVLVRRLAVAQRPSSREDSTLFRGTPKNA